MNESNFKKRVDDPQIRRKKMGRIKFPPGDKTCHKRQPIYSRKQV